MKTNIDDTTLQAAIDEACQKTTISNSYQCLDLRPAYTFWSEEAPSRLALAKAFLARLPEPTPPVVDGKTPGQVAWEAGNKVQKRKFPNDPVIPWKDGAELHEQLEAAASAVLAAFGGEFKARAEKAEAELDKPGLSRLRPIAEPGPVPDGAVRWYGYLFANKWQVGESKSFKDTHFAALNVVLHRFVMRDLPQTLKTL